MDSYMAPALVALTTAHHLTLIVLSIIHKVGLPFTAYTPDPNLANRSASPTDPNFGSSEATIVEERRASTRNANYRYPSYMINVANCTITFFLALGWVAGASLVFVLSSIDESFSKNPRIEVIPNIEGTFMLLESFLLFFLSAQFVRYREKQRSRTIDSIRMTRSVVA
ncbi:hypothetical protein CPB86DRAFT_818827 [Serendipita vermifera]|nr:hypothetical protein CPB86DRAFT_818827 [Serendipita vermifera]